jgi:Co/Zn/Cd efflux system component
VSLLALAAPVLAVALVAVFCWFAIRVLRRLFRKREPAPESPSR